MIVEMRTYVLKVGAIHPFLQHMEQEGISIEQSILGNLLGFYSTEIGCLNKVIHLWGYDSFEERERRRTRLYQDPRWIAFVPTVLPLIERMDNELLNPATFSPR